jgi:hypothetical protein
MMKDDDWTDRCNSKGLRHGGCDENPIILCFLVAVVEATMRWWVAIVGCVFFGRKTYQPAQRRIYRWENKRLCRFLSDDW